MKNFRYNVNAYFEKAETTLRTNDVKVAVQEFMDYLEDGLTCDVVDGCTGEVIAIANNSNHDDYATEEWALMMRGMLYLNDQVTAQAEEDECTECEDEQTTAEGMILGLIQALGGLPS